MRQNKEKNISTKEKIVQYLENQGVSANKFCVICGFSNGFLKKKGSIGTDKLIKIRENYPNLNMSWLLFDEGDMIVPQDKVSEKELEYKVEKPKKDRSQQYQLNEIYNKLDELGKFKNLVLMKLDIDDEFKKLLEEE